LQTLGLAAFWVALWGDPSPGTVIAGLLAGVAVVVLVQVPASDRHLVLRPVAEVRFVLSFTGMLVASTWAVVRLVLSPGAADAYGILIEFELQPASYPVRTLIANAISLTPGTLTVDVGDDGRTLYVHVMDEATVVPARRAIAALEARAARAFAPGASDVPPPGDVPLEELV
jgi:multicomponent Na+:H+ antiporter subunit E